MTKLGSWKLHICLKGNKIGSIIGHRIDYNGVGAPRGQRQIATKNGPNYPPPPPPPGSSQLEGSKDFFWSTMFLHVTCTRMKKNVLLLTECCFHFFLAEGKKKLCAAINFHNPVFPCQTNRPARCVSYGCCFDYDVATCFKAPGISLHSVICYIW